MSEGEVIVSGGEASESGEDILEGLPPWMPRTESSGNFKLLDVVGRGFDRLDDDIEEADKASTVQDATSIGQLKELAKLVELPPKSNEGVEKYRRRIVGEFQNTTNEGDIPGIFNNISILLDIDKSDIGFERGDKNGNFTVDVPATGINSASLTKEEFIDIISGQVAAGFQVNIRPGGTFTFITPSQYNNDDHNADRGYDGLDANNNPKDNGGTYAGVIN